MERMPFERLFNKTERRSFTGTTKEDIVSNVSAFWRSKGFNINFLSPFQVHVEGRQTKWGLRRVADLWISDAGDAVAVDINFSAALGDGEAALGVVGAVISLPVTAVVGAVSYTEYQKDAYDLINEFWHYMGSRMAGEGSRKGTCAKCGGTIDEGSKFCMHCGERVEE